MNQLFSVILALILITGLAPARAEPLSGTVEVLAEDGSQIQPSLPITGDLDIANNTMSVAPFSFFGFQTVTQSIELLGEGTHTRPDGAGGTISTSVGPDQLGAYMVVVWNINSMPLFMVWDVNSHANGASYTTIDSDGDGVRGQALTINPFPGLSLIYDFTVGEPPPGIDVAIDVEGGTTQECAEAGGSSVSLTASITLTGGAELGSIEWYVDGESAGTESSITPFLTLGPHSIEVLVSTTTGESDGNTLSVTIQDTTPPDLEVAFLDQNGNPITSVSPGNYVTASIVPSDVCDPQPLAEGSAVPVFEVSDGDSIKVQSGKINTVALPTTAIELSATASDASANQTSGMAVLSITE